jgi:hypothetical protein
MNLVDDHIQRILKQYVQLPETGFQLVFDNIENIRKEDARRLLIYVDKLLNTLVNDKRGSLAYTHLHFEELEDDIVHLIYEFLILKSFFLCLEKDNSEEESSKLILEIAKVRKSLSGGLQVSKGLSGKSKAFQRLLQERDSLAKRKTFLEMVKGVNAKASFNPKFLVNLSQKQQDYFSPHPAEHLLFCPIDELHKHPTYLITNFDKTRNEIDKIEFQGNHLLDLIENVIIFDCEQKKIHHGFNYNDLSEWNRNGSQFKNIILFTFSDKPFVFNRLRTMLERTCIRFHSLPKYPNYHTYTILPSETHMLLGKSINRQSNIKFYGEPTCVFWEKFKDCLNFYEGLYELKSLKLMNIYALAISERVRDIIINDIFSLSEKSELTTQDTQESLKELSIDSLDEIKIELTNTLNWIIQSDWKNTLLKDLNEGTTLVLPDLAINSKSLINEFRTSLNLSHFNNIISWDKDIPAKSKHILVIYYRDSGPYPFKITPNISEHSITSKSQVDFLLMRMFFENRFHWYKYEINKALIDILKHPIREQFFEWEKLLYRNNASKPQKKDQISWTAESNFQNDNDRSILKIKYVRSSKLKSFPLSELFISEIEEDGKLKVYPIDDLMELNLSGIHLRVQQLEELYAEFNLYERLADTKKEEGELKVIRNAYGLSEKETPVRLWKVLLKRETNYKGENEVYDELTKLIKARGRNIVSREHFKRVWLEPDCETMIARGKTVFRTVCEYLKLPKSYLLIMYRLYNQDKLSKTKSSKQMNALLRDLFNDGCFDRDVDNRKVLSLRKDYYLTNHDIEGIGIHFEAVVDNLSTLVELLRPNLNLKEVERIELNLS